MQKPFSLLSALLATLLLQAQADRWQQRVKYKMDIEVDAAANRFSGKQALEYWNNSPDTLRVLYYHLYWNAFQPGSMMDARSQELGKKLINGRPDWDARVRDRIARLQPDEIGYQRVRNLKVNGKLQATEAHETILKVVLDKPILPKSSCLIELEFEAQVPVQIRRSGRDNAEGVRFSMAQWYPKLCQYDSEGWHPTPYVAREFYGIWGDYDVTIRIDSSYVVGGTGYLQNPQEIGHGYEAKGMPLKRPASPMLAWRFTAPRVHDFVWAADPEYIHASRTVRDGLVLHAFYKVSRPHLEKQWNALSEGMKRQQPLEAYIARTQSEWKGVLDLAAKAIPYMDKIFGKYPYRQYSFIQGGDGGMEYPMATLLKGAGKGVVIHEWMHSWYQMMMGSNESLHAWMDEGFTSYGEARVANFLDGGQDPNPHLSAFQSYIRLAKSEHNEPLTTHSDQYASNYAYTTNAYAKGEVFLEQLGYILGAQVRDQVLLAYYDRWKYRHPTPADFIRVAEEVSGLQLDWYRTFFVNTSKTIDYGIDSLWGEKGKMKIRLRNIGTMPMPIDLELKFKDGSCETAYIPQYLMFGSKAAEDPSLKRTVGAPWKWTHPTYTLEIDRKLTDLKSLEIDPLQRTADMERRNNKIELNW
ncbi:MAG: M1 family metallopeptidase [Bacteroidetes bacterium]|nr:M1 family metallopeptidase [Bacteroidota bacterium]